MVEHIPKLVIIEDYRVYSWKAKEHSWSDMHTSRLIGAIETLCTFDSITPTKQMAGSVKGFCSDKRLREWGFWLTGQQHARDAVRHACYYILFHKEKKP